MRFDMAENDSPESPSSSNSDVLPLVYYELRRIAAAQMSRNAPGMTLQPTALVHEAWLRLGQERQFESRTHFFAAAAEAMRHILIDRARQRRALRHGGGQQRIDITEIEVPVDTEDDDKLIAISEAIDKLALEHPQAADLAKLRCFAGLEITDAAKSLGIPRTTAYRRWVFARTWLFQELVSRK